MIPDAASVVFGPEVDLVAKYVDILSTRGVERGLIGPREVERLWERHVLNSMAVADEVPLDAFVVDVGSGAGLPGIPLAIGRPDLKITLLEPLLRRSTFLEETVAELELGDRVRVVRGRAEEHQETYDVVTARAVAPLPRLVEWCAPLLARRGKLVLLKGESARDEVRDARDVLRRYGLRGEVHEVLVHPEGETTWVVVCR